MATRDINIVLVGETGVGKSTFINAFVNYLKFDNLQDAVNSENIHCLIPCRFPIADDDFEDHIVEFGEDSNESIKAGQSCTQAPRSYKFSFSGINVRLIDTPGIGDTRGIIKDEENFDRVLLALGELEDVHAFCILLMPNSSRLTVQFQYCIKQLLSRLEKTASENIVFVLTNSRSTFYKPGATSSAVKILLRELEEKPPYVKIPFSKNNVFCMDNEGFRFLLAKRQGVVTFTELQQKDFGTSWDQSASVCQSLIVHIADKPPHSIQDTVCVNEARRLILNLSQPLVDIVKNIDDNLKTITKKEKELDNDNQSAEELKKQLCYEITKFNVIKLDHPRTVCADRSCIRVYKVNDAKHIDYSQICHERCYLNGVAKEVLGPPELKNCDIMDSNSINATCIKCNHSYLLHMHIYYKTEAYKATEMDPEISDKIKSKEQLIQEKKNLIEKLKRDKIEMAEEKETVQNSMAKFAHFLRNNAMAAYNDKYQEYVNYLIKNEECEGEDKDLQLISDLRKMIAVHTEQQRILDDQLEIAKERDTYASVISAQDIIELTTQLFSLKRYGNVIKEYYESQQPHTRQENLLYNERNIEHHWYDPLTRGFNKVVKYGNKMIDKL